MAAEKGCWIWPQEIIDDHYKDTFRKVVWGWPDCNTLRNTHELKTESMDYSEEKLGGKIEEHGNKIIQAEGIAVMKKRFLRMQES